MHQLTKLLIQCITLLMLLLVLTEPAWAQCPMCKGAVEASQKEGSAAADGINIGIVYLFVMPYLLVAVIGYQWYWAQKKSKAEN